MMNNQPNTDFEIDNHTLRLFAHATVETRQLDAVVAVLRDLDGTVQIDAPDAVWHLSIDLTGTTCCGTATIDNIEHTWLVVDSDEFADWICEHLDVAVDAWRTS